MEKIFKKSLALMVSAALCLTAFVGCLTVNAEETATPTYEITAQNGKAGDTVEVKVDGTNLTSVCGQQLFINIPSDLTIASVKDNDGNAYVNAAEVAVGDAFDYNVVTTETTKQVRFVDIINFPAAGELGAIETAEFHVVFGLTIPENAEAGKTYTIGSDDLTMFANYGEEEIAITVAPATITVQAAQPACEHANATYDYSVVDGNCVTKKVCPDCGNEETIATIASKTITPNPVLASGLSIRFRIKKTDVADYTDLYGEFTKDTYDGETYLGKSAVENIGAAAQGTNWQFEYAGIASYEMTCTIHINIFAKDSNNNVVLIATLDYALADFFKTRLATSGVYTDANMNLYADILRYGAESQIAMGYHTDALANAGVTTDYGTELPTSFTNTGSTATGSVAITPNVVVGNSVKFRIRFSQESVSAYDFSTLKMTIGYINSYGTEDTEVATSDKFTSATNGKNWQYEFASLPCASINDYFVIKIFDGDNELASLTYSFQSYASTRYTSSASNATLCQAIVAYSNSAKVAFGLS